MKNAILCKIVDPYSQLTEPTAYVNSIEEAIARGCIVSNDATVLTRVGSVNQPYRKKIFASVSRTAWEWPYK